MNMEDLLVQIHLAHECPEEHVEDERRPGEEDWHLRARGVLAMLVDNGFLDISEY